MGFESYVMKYQIEMEKNLENGIKENVDFIKYASSQDDIIKGMFGMHASFTLSDETLKKCVEE